MSIRQAWALGIVILIIYAYGKFGNIFKAFNKTQFKELVNKHLKLLGVFLVLANIFFLPLHWNQQYGPFAQIGGDIIHHSDPAKRLDDFNLSAAGFEEGASLKKRIDYIKHMINQTYTDDYKTLPSKFINPPDADYKTTVKALGFSHPYQVFVPSVQFHFLSDTTNYPAHFAVMAFVYACFITSVTGFFRSFGRVPAIFSALLCTGSQAYVAAFYNHFLFQNISSLVLGLFFAAVPHVKLFSLTGLKTYIIGISMCWFSNYSHYIPVLLPLMTVASLYWFYPKSTISNQKEENKDRNWLHKLSLLIGWASFAIFGLIAHWISLKSGLLFFQHIIRIGTRLKPLNAGEKIPVFSENWWAQAYGFLSHYDLPPFVFTGLKHKIIQIVVTLGLAAGFMALATGLVLVILSKFKPWTALSAESNKTNWHLIGIYTALILTVVLYTPLSQGGAYFQMKSFHYLLPCVYFILLLPLIIFFRSDKNFFIFFKNGKRSDWKFITAWCYIFPLALFALTLLIPRIISLKRLGSQEHISAIMHPSYFSEIKRAISEDNKAFFLFEPRKASDVYFGNQPFSGYRVVPTKYLVLSRYDNSNHSLKGKYIVGATINKGKYKDALPSEFIEPEDLPHLWSLTSKDKINWQAERLVSRKSPNLYFTGHAYNKNVGLKYRQNNYNKSNFDPNDQGLFSYLRNGTTSLYLPPGGPYHLEVKVINKDETNKAKSDQMAEEIAEKVKAGEFPSLTSMKQDGPIVTMEYLFEKSNTPRFSLVSIYDGGFWFSARLDGKDIVAG